MPPAATRSAAVNRVRWDSRLGTTMPSAATTDPSATIGTASEQAPRLISSRVTAYPCSRTRAS